MNDLSIKILKYLQDDYINHKDFLDRPIRHKMPESLQPKRISVFDITLKTGASTPDVEKRLIELEGIGYIAKLVSDKVTPLPETNTLIELTDEGYKFIASHKESAKKPLKIPLIEFSNNGELKDVNNNILIKRYKQKDLVYDTCNYLFVIRKTDKNSWISWDEIADYLDGGKTVNIDKQTIYDQIKLVNSATMKKIGQKVIDNNGKYRFKVLY